jgi:hypothetical protein
MNTDNHFNLVSELVDQSHYTSRSVSPKIYAGERPYSLKEINTNQRIDRTRRELSFNSARNSNQLMPSEAFNSNTRTFQHFLSGSFTPSKQVNQNTSVLEMKDSTPLGELTQSQLG